MTAADGSPYGLFVYHQRHSGPGWSTGSTQGAIELPSRRRSPLAEVESDLRFDDANRRLLGGTLPDGTRRDFSVRPASDTGFHLGTGLYGGWQRPLARRMAGRAPRRRRAHLRVRRSRDRPPAAQHRDCIVVVEDPAAGGTGVGTVQSNRGGCPPVDGADRRGLVSLTSAARRLDGGERMA
jgi:hypothetical protein